MNVNKYTIRQYSTYEEVKDISNLWREIYIRNKELSPYQSYEWNKCLIENKIFRGKLRFLVLYKFNRPLIIAPFVVRNKVVYKEIGFIGERSHSDYLNFIYDKDMKFEDFEYFISKVLNKNKIMTLRCINESTLIFKYLEELEVAKDKQIDICVKIPICKTIEEYNEKLSKNTKRVLKQRQNKANVKYGERLQFKFYICEAIEEPIIEKVIDLYCVRQRERYNRNFDDNYQNYLVEYLKRNNNNIALGVCFIDDNLVACHVGLLSNDKNICGIMVAIDLKYKEIGAGNQLLYEFICNLIAENNKLKNDEFKYMNYDLTRGNEEYKYKFGGIEHYNYDYTLAAFKGFIWIRVLKRSLRAFIVRYIKKLIKITNEL